MGYICSQLNLKNVPFRHGANSEIRKNSGELSQHQLSTSFTRKEDQNPEALPHLWLLIYCHHLVDVWLWSPITLQCHRLRLPSVLLHQGLGIRQTTTTHNGWFTGWSLLPSQCVNSSQTFLLDGCH